MTTSTKNLSNTKGRHSPVIAATALLQNAVVNYQQPETTENIRSPRIGTCDVCCAENVELVRSFVTGIETFHCADGCAPRLAARHRRPG